MFDIIEVKEVKTRKKATPYVTSRWTQVQASSEQSIVAFSGHAFTIYFPGSTVPAAIRTPD
jgi:CRISPR/Cas system CSM-associated protein Csm5 (group 7 of RAMP superfamily)